jgi:hypothetical protein
VSGIIRPPLAALDRRRVEGREVREEACRLAARVLVRARVRVVLAKVTIEGTDMKMWTDGTCLGSLKGTNHSL